MLKRTLAPSLFLALLLVSCNQQPTNILTSQTIATAPGVAFQPPIGLTKVLTGNFDDTINLSIEVFDLVNGEAVGVPIGPSFSTTNGSITIKNKPGKKEYYQAKYDILASNRPEGATVRVEVRLGNAPPDAPACNPATTNVDAGCLAFIDLELHPDDENVVVLRQATTTTQQETNNHEDKGDDEDEEEHEDHEDDDPNVIKLEDDTTLEIRLHIEHGAANVAPIVNITNPANNTTIDQGDNLTLTGTAVDLEDGDISTSINWVSDLDGTLGTGANISTTSLSIGTHNITASVTDSGGKSGADTIILEVQPGCTPFSEDFESDLSNWSLIGNWQLRTDQGPSQVLYFPSTGGGAVWSKRNDFGFGTYTMHFRVDNAAIGDFNFRFHSDRDTAGGGSDEWSFNGYTAKLVPAGSDSAPSRLFRNAVDINGTPIPLPPLDSQRFGLTAGAWHALEVERHQDGTILVFLDGELNLSAIDTIYMTPGFTGFRSWYPIAVDDFQYDCQVDGQPNNTVPTLSIIAPADATNLSYASAGSITLEAVATDAEDGNISANIGWSSSLDGSLDTGGTITTSLLAGKHGITASITDSDGNTITKTIQVTVTMHGIIVQGFTPGQRDIQLYMIDPIPGSVPRLIEELSYAIPAWKASWDDAMERLYFGFGENFVGDTTHVEHHIARIDPTTGQLGLDPSVPSPLGPLGGYPDQWHPLEDSVLRSPFGGFGIDGPIYRKFLDGITPDVVYLDPAWVGDAVVGAGNLDFTADKSKLVWHSSISSCASCNNIWLAQIDANGEVDRSKPIINLTPNTPTTGDYGPRFSPDSTKVAFIRSAWGNSEPNNLWVTDITDTNNLVETQLTFFPSGVVSEPKEWSPDGTSIVVGYYNGTQFDLYLVNATTGSLTQLTFTPNLSEVPMDWR